MKGKIQGLIRLVALGGGIIILSLWVAGTARAVPLTFNLEQGGQVGYAGGASVFSTSGGVVSSVTGGASTQTLINARLELETGIYTGNNFVTASGFISEFAGAGFVKIFGDVGLGSGEVELFSGNFFGPSYFNCCSSGGSSTFNGSLNVFSVNTELANLLGFNPPPIGGSIAQFQILLNPAPSAPGMAFSGTQGGGQVFVSESVPEPSTLVLLGSALLGAGLLSRRRVDKNVR